MLSKDEVERYFANLPCNIWCKYCDLSVGRENWGRHIGTLEHKENLKKGVVDEDSFERFVKESIKDVVARTPRTPKIKER